MTITLGGYAVVGTRRKAGFDTLCSYRYSICMGKNEKTPNLLTIDVEDWFHILDASAGAPDTQQWETLPSRVVQNTQKLMDIMERRGANATFFILGWVARQYPDLIAEIHGRGFDVASHGDQHVLVHRLTPTQFEDDLVASLDALKTATGVPVRGYRAAGFSITQDTPWAFDLLAENGIEYDASVFPGGHAHGGYTVPHRHPFLLTTPGGKKLYEFPVAAARLFGRSIPFGGGGYFRITPGKLTRHLVNRMNREGIPATLYLHPREIDAAQPRMKNLPLMRRFKYYVNLASTEAKLDRLLQESTFISMSDYLQSEDRRQEAASRPFTVGS